MKRTCEKILKGEVKNCQECYDKAIERAGKNIANVIDKNIIDNLNSEGE